MGWVSKSKLLWHWKGKIMKKEIYPVCRIVFLHNSKKQYASFHLQISKKENRIKESGSPWICNSDLTITCSTHLLIYLTNIIYLLLGFKHNVFWGESKKIKYVL